MLGFESLHWEPQILEAVVLGQENNPNFRSYDHCEFICDILHAYFFQEIGEEYPGLKFILTVRDEQEWYESMCRHFSHQAEKTKREEEIRKIVYGTSLDDNPKFLLKKRFRDWNDTINRTIPETDLLIMNVCDKVKPDGFPTLCAFVGKPDPGEPFPHQNKSR